MITNQIKNDAPADIKEVKEMFATTKYEYECIQKLVHQNTEGVKELKKISAHFFEGKIYIFKKISLPFFCFFLMVDFL